MSFSMWLLTSLALLALATAAQDGSRKSKRGNMQTFEKSGLSPSNYFSEIQKSKECPANTRRVDLKYSARKKFSCSVKPGKALKKGKAFYALGGAKTKSNEPLMATMYGNNKVKFVVKPKGSDVMYVRRLCAWNFMVTGVTVKMFLENKLVSTQRWTPAQNSAWFRFGCTKNDWLQVDRIEMNFAHSVNAHFHLKDTFAEICI